jgi:8-oxo-dGTP pyrophosphatase MutT (NUDIX family)
MLKLGRVPGTVARDYNGCRNLQEPRSQSMAPNELTREFIAERLWPAPYQGELNGDFRVGGWKYEGTATMPAAVLVPIVQRPSGFTVLLTQRTDHLHHHPGQISFPGGRMEDDDNDPVTTAMRETEEEIGLGRAYLEVIGFLDPYQSVTGFRVTPVVAFVRPGFRLELDAFEVAEAFEVPLSFVLNPDHHQRQSRRVAGQERRYYVLWYDGRRIWGATAAMLINLYEKLKRPSNA